MSLYQLNIFTLLVVCQYPKFEDDLPNQFLHLLRAILSYNVLNNTKYQKYYKANDFDVFIFRSFNFINFYLALYILHNL